MRCFYRLLMVFSFVSCLFHASVSHAADLKRVIVLRPDNDHPFWELFEKASRAACKNLDCEVESIKSDWNQIEMVSRFEARLKQEPKPDLVLFQSFKRNGPDIIALAEKYKVYAFLINADIDAQQSEQIGSPREKYKYWIGRMMPDDARGGKLMAQFLYAQAKKKSLARDGVVKFAGIEGNIADGASIERVKGLKAFLSETPKVTLTQIVSGKWMTDLSAEQTKNLMSRYPDVPVIWAVGDTTAIGVVKGIKAQGKVPGKDVLTAGLDWSNEGLEAVKNGELEGSVGGHFMEGAWAIIATYDYMHGHDFAKSDGVSMHSAMALITKKNVDAYLDRFGSGDFSKVNFKQFSKTFQPALKKYELDFSFALK